MSDQLRRVLEEDKRQEKLLRAAIEAADSLSPVSRRALYRSLENRLLTDLRGGGTGLPDGPLNRSTSVEKGTFVDKAHEFLLARKEGATTREVAGAIGQELGPADATLRYLANDRKIASRRGKLWFAKAPPKGTASEREPTLTHVIRQVFENNGNRPLAANELFAAVQETLPNVRKGSVDTLSGRMRKRGELVRNGSGARGGLYHLARSGGGDATDVH